MHRHSVRATNWATTSANKIHDDEVARRYGFRGGLVPGVTVFAYLIHPIVASFGTEWLSSGWADVRFVSPAYDGDTVEATVEGATVELRDSGSSLCATGTCGVGGPIGPVDIPIGPPAARGNRPPASLSSLAPGTVLGSVEHTFHADKAGAYLSSIEDDDPRYEAEGIAHPGWLLLDANEVLAGSVVLGPWIHVSSRTRQLRPVTDGQLVSTRGRVAENYERKGHRFVELDVVMYADAEPAMTVRHTAIWEVRTDA